jgi:hypothetical protein
MSTAAKPLLDRAAILGADDREYELVDVPQWGGTVRVRALSGTDRDRYLQSLYEVADDGSGNFKVSSVRLDGSSIRLVAMSIVDGEGQPIFSNEDVAALAEKNGAAIGRLNEVATRLSGLQKSTEEAKRDLKAARNGSSGTA